MKLSSKIVHKDTYWKHKANGRGSTAGSSPMNSALPIEEAYRDSKDNNTTLQLVLLDAKAAFDTVIHSHLQRKVYLAGIDDKHWTLIKDLHENAQFNKV